MESEDDEKTHVDGLAKPLSRFMEGEKGLTSKLASPLHEPYLQLKEAQGAEVLVTSAHSLPLPLHPVPHTATATNNTFQIWEDPDQRVQDLQHKTEASLPFQFPMQSHHFP
ncbi:hypothetical protein NUW58_g7874 [Xylaria curta]|uniref:Uncharacterized protein n=1 Tax=Xylaria curta TaxID=42375 RepID=A0ACC1ND49_9PEZI|nr:hypothetical protein NUW58_g7874 [Xylaria curta]